MWAVQTREVRHNTSCIIVTPVLWEVAMCSLVYVYRRCKGTCFLRRQSRRISRVAVFFIVTAVRTSNVM
jgi:hypothetical protein